MFRGYRACQSRRPALTPGSQGYAPSFGTDSIVFWMMLQLAKTELLHQRRDINTESTAKALLQAIPTSDGIGRGAPPCFDCVFFGRLLLIGATKLNPSAGGFQHGVQVVNATGIVGKNGLADG